MPDTPRTDTTRLQRIAQAYWESAALMAAVELEIFTAIAHGSDTIRAVAKAAGISERNAERLRDRQENRLGAYVDFTVEDARRYHAATYSIGMGAARLFSRSVDLSSRRRMLDLGGGSGAYSIVATRTFPGLQAIVLDLPPVTVVADEYIAANGATARVSTLPGDFTQTAFPQDVDVVVMASNLPQYEPALIRRVVAKAFEALVPGGEMHLIGETLHDDRSGPLSAALWGLNEAVQNSTGLAHTESEVTGYLEEAGFADVTVHPFVPGVLSRIAGRKPG